MLDHFRQFKLLVGINIRAGFTLKSVLQTSLHMNIMPNDKSAWLEVIREGLKEKSTGHKWEHRKRRLTDSRSLMIPKGRRRIDACPGLVTHLNNWQGDYQLSCPILKIILKEQSFKTTEKGQWWNRINI